LDLYIFFYIAKINLKTSLSKMKLVFITNLKAFFLFLIQYLSLFMLIVTGPLFPSSLPLLIFYIAGWILGIWSILAMGLGNINAGPDPLPEGRLVSRGPYAVIRHPMYAAILLVFIPLLLDHFTIPRLFILMLLIINLLLKIRYEEKQMNLSHCKKYSEYSASTWQLIPYVL
jgi:protein-S-isoprenylcysteine O-methyltransferase Ste14